VEEVFANIIKEGNTGNFCTCSQCRLDTACYALNRTSPRYIISNRGAARAELETIARQQSEADITTLIYEGLKRVNHNQRPFFNHSEDALAAGASEKRAPVFNIPSVVGRLFDGSNFAPVSNVKIELRRNGDLVPMKDKNWQNPYNLVSQTEGTFVFWPVPIPAESADLHKIFEYSIKIEGQDFEPLTHFFKIPVMSEIQSASSFSLERTFKLPDLYMFPPGEAEKNGYLD
jgi:competence protein ComFB